MRPPALVLVVDLEAPPRVYFDARTAGDTCRAAAWAAGQVGEIHTALELALAAIDEHCAEVYREAA